MSASAAEHTRAQTPARGEPTVPPAPAAPAAQAPAPKTTTPAPAPATRTEPEPDVAPATNAARAQERRGAQLYDSLEQLARLESMSGVVASIGGIVLGGFTTAYGVSVAIDGDELGQTTGRAGWSGVAISAGLVMVGRGLYTLLAAEETDATRLSRFQQRGGVRADGETLAHFEGELEAAAAIARAQRIGNGFGSLGLAAAGGVLIGFGASSELEGSAQTGAYVFGGTLLGLGLLQSASSFLLSSPHERVWARYQGLRMADASDLTRISVAPVIGPRTFALNVQARF